MLIFQILALVAAGLVAVSEGAGAATHGTTQAHISDPAVAAELKRISDELKQFKDSTRQTISGLARQMMLQQLYVEERTRSNGGSGVKMIRQNAGGTKPYHFTSTSSGSITAIHEHSNYDRTVGMGEFIGVLNGLEFRTRHNDYKLKMPSTTKDYNAVVDIPFPAVPPSVLNKKTVAEQVTEMQQYFKAFHEQNTHIRDYRPYFKPVMCYLEGGWTTNTKTLSEPFESDRHFVDASSWMDLQEKVRYTSASGGKSQNENYPYLPTTIINVTADGEPIYAQWNYRILCHPIKKDLALKDLQHIDDLAARMLLAKNYTEVQKSKIARYGISPYGSHAYSKDSESGTYSDRRFLHGRLDDIMLEIPGKENYHGTIHDDSFGLLKYRVDTKNNTILNTARYHRHFKVTRTGAMGLSVRNRGYSDPYMFVAETNNPRIAQMSVEDCPRVKGHKVCTTYKARHTYAIPLEIIWLTPLSTWNPYNLPLYHNNIPNAHGRNGGFTTAKAYNGTSSNTWYYTPVEFYHGGETGRDPADTAKDAVGILDSHGNVQRVTASGIRIFTPEIPGVGTVRIRYPVMPLHEEGNNIYKNLVALQDITMDMKKYNHQFKVAPQITSSTQAGSAHQADSHYRTSTTHANPPGAHYHDLYLTAEEMFAIRHTGTAISAYTTENSGHQHEIVVKMDPAHPDFTRLQMITCDHQNTCWDHHSHYVYLQKN